MKFFIILLLFTSIFLLSTSCNESTKTDYNRDKTTAIRQKLTLQGTYKKTKMGIYNAFEFRGNNTVIVHSIGLEFKAKYKKNGNIITIIDQKSRELTLKIIDHSKLIGLGFAKGTYKK